MSINQVNQLLLEGKVDEAIKGYRYALSLKPDDLIIRENLALALITKGLYDEARELLGNNPDSDSGCNLLGNIYFYKRDFLKAKEYYEKAIGLDSKCGDAWSNLGNIFCEFKEFGKAEDCYRRAVEIGPSNPYWHTNLAKALLLQNKIEPAIESYKKALSINPGLKDVAETLCNIYNRLAGVKLLANDYTGAYSLYEECKKACPAVDLRRYPNLLRFR